MTLRRKIVAGNWKMNNSLPEAMDLINSIISELPVNPSCEVIIFPPFPLIYPVSDLLNDKSIGIGAQNCSEHKNGAYTGEVSANILHSVGCKYVLVGHSERRMYFNENNSQLGAKIRMILDNGLTPVFCIGEKLEERNNNKHFEVVSNQLNSVLKDFNAAELNSLIIAYEPVWAIGTGVTASSLQAQEMHAYIRKTIAELFGNSFAEKLTILYGGSCNAQNAKELFECKDVDGGLIGGASLKAKDFCAIINSF